MPNRAIPLWVTVVCSLIARMGLFVGGSLFVSPGTFIPNTDFANKSVRFLALMWATRSVVIGHMEAYD